MDESNFLLVANATLQSVFDQLEDNLTDYLDADLDSGVLTVSFQEESEYVINRHLPKRQIWMSSPISGGTHFDYHEDTGKWRATKDPSITFRELFAQELRQLTGVPFYFDQ